MEVNSEEMKAIYKSLCLKEIRLQVLMSDAENHLAEIKAFRKKFEQRLSNDKEKEQSCH